MRQLKLPVPENMGGDLQSFAEEVRNLAQRSSTASKDITTLITDSVHKATTGMELVKKTEDVFTGVVAQVKKVTDLVNEYLLLQMSKTMEYSK